MKAPKKTHVGAAVFFERLADDGWPEDAGCWPIGGCPSSPVKRCDEPVQLVRRRSMLQFIRWYCGKAVDRSCLRLAWCEIRCWRKLSVISTPAGLTNNPQSKGQ